MTTGNELFVTIGGRDVGLQAILQKVDAEMQVSAQKAVALGQSYARLASAQGAPVLGGRILASTMQQVTGASQQAVISLETQAARLANSGNAFAQFGQSAASSLTGLLGPAALATGAISGLIAVGRSVEDAFAFKAQLDASTLSINTLLRGVRDSGEVWAGAARFANEYKLTQQQTNEAIQASIRIIRSSKAPMEDILGAFARLRVLSPEKTFSDASRALSELQAGQVVSIEHLFNVPRRDANEMKKEIEGGRDAVLVLNDYLTRTGVTMDAVRAGTTGAMGAMKELAQSSERLKLALGDEATGPGLLILQTRIRATDGLTNLLRGDTAAMGQGIKDTLTTAAGASAAFNAYASAILSGASAADAQAAASQAGAAAALSYANTWTSAGGAILQASNVTAANTLTMDEDRVAIGQLQVAIETQVAAQQAQAAEMQTAAAASVADTAAKSAQAATTALLEGQTRLAADAFLSLNPNISQSGIASAVAAGQISAAVAQYINMTIAAANARNQLAQLQAQAGVSPALKAAAVAAGGGDVGRYITRTDTADAARGAANVARLKQLNAQEQAHADAVRQSVVQTGSAADKQALLNKELADATRVYGANSTEAIKARTALVQYQQQQAKKAGGGGGGAGGIKLSDQQKLDNSLLADQEKYQQKYDDVEAQHAQKRYDIMLDFQEKMLTAQKDFAQERLDSSASFYDNLGGIENQKIAQAASAAYEAAALEAGKVAEAKGADVGERYMAAQEQVISARAKRQAEIEKAAKEGEKGRAEYLKGVDAQYRAAEDAKIARIKEGEGSLAAERDKQLADEDRSYEEQQGKLAGHAEASADRRVAAAEPAGKAIDAEAAKAGGLAATYDRIAPAATPAAAAGAPGAAAGAAGAAADPITVAISGAKDAIVAALAAVERAAKETTGAVKGIKATGGVAG